MSLQEEVEDTRQVVGIDVPGDEIRAHVRRITDSRPFARAARLRRFFEFVMEQSLRDPSGHLKEHTIGVAVFDRDPDYDPRVDPIVRVEARRLRARLQAYYEACGLNEPVQFVIPKGRYVPEIRAAASMSTAERPGVWISVAPFVTLDAEGRRTPFANGLHGELLHQLIQSPEIRVVSSHGPGSPQGSARRPPHVHTAAAAVLQGSIRQTRNAVRINAQLIDTRTGAYLWSGMYDRTLADALSVQGEVAEVIAQDVRGALAAR